MSAQDELQLVCSEMRERAASRQSKLQSIEDSCEKLGGDELRVLDWLAKRLLVGKERYGNLDIANKPIDWRKERTEEAMDLLVYSAIISLKEDLK